MQGPPEVRSSNYEAHSSHEGLVTRDIPGESFWIVDCFSFPMRLQSFRPEFVPYLIRNSFICRLLVFVVSEDAVIELI